MSDMGINSARASSPSPSLSSRTTQENTAPAPAPIDQYEAIIRPVGSELAVTLSEDGKEIALRTNDRDVSTAALFRQIHFELACTYFARPHEADEGNTLVLKSLLGPNVSLYLLGAQEESTDIRFYASQIAAKIVAQSGPERTRFIDLKEKHQKVLSFIPSSNPPEMMPPIPSWSDKEPLQ